MKSEVEVEARVKELLESGTIKSLIPAVFGRVALNRSVKSYKRKYPHASETALKIIRGQKQWKSEFDEKRAFATYMNAAVRERNGVPRVAEVRLKKGPWRNSKSELAAATRIQAAARGMLARTAVKSELAERAAVKKELAERAAVKKELAERAAYDTMAFKTACSIQ
jgi:hypothetical protein